MGPLRADEFVVTDMVPLAPPRCPPRPRCTTCNGLGFTGRLLARSEDDPRTDDERVPCRDCAPGRRR
jgi:hypothetical protein